MATRSSTTIRYSNVEVEVAGKTHANWQEYRVDSDFLTPADSFDLDIGLPNGIMPPDIDEGAECTIKVDGTLILTGIIDTISHRIDKRDHSYSINGRDKAALLVDCSAPITNFKNLSLLEAVKKIAEPLGITKVELRGKAEGDYDKTDIEVGQTAWDAIARLANSAGLHPWMEPDGTLVIGEADYKSPPVAVLTLNFDATNNNAISLEEEKSSSNRYSEITFLGQSHGRKSDSAKHDLKYVYKDDDAKFDKKKIIVVGDAENQKALEKQAKKILADMQIEGLTIRVTLQGHYAKDDVLYKNGQRVHIKSDVFEIDDIYFVMGRTFYLSRYNGTTTQLSLKADGVWLPDSPNAEKQRKKGKGKGKKPKRELVTVPVGEGS